MSLIGIQIPSYNQDSSPSTLCKYTIHSEIKSTVETTKHLGLDFSPRISERRTLKLAG